MRKALIICIFGLLVLTGCSALAPATATPITATPTLPTSTATSTSSPSPTSTPTSTHTPIPTPTTTPTPLGGTGAIVYDGYSFQTDQGGPTGIVYFDLTTKSSTVLFEAGYYLLGTSPDRTSLLLIKDHALYAVNIGSLSIISSRAIENLANNLFDQSPQAVWYENDRIVFIGWEGESRYLYQVSPAGGEIQKITQKGMRPVKLFPSNGREMIFWASGTITGNSTHLQSYWAQTWDGSPPVELAIEYPRISPHEDFTAYFPNNIPLGQEISLVIENLQNGEKIVISEKFGDKSYTGGEIFWANNGMSLIAELTICTLSATNQVRCGEAGSDYILIRDGVFISMLNLPEEVNWVNDFTWSPDDQWLFFQHIEDSGSMYKKYLYNPESDELIDLSDYFPPELFFTNVFWVDAGGVPLE